MKPFAAPRNLIEASKRKDDFRSWFEALPQTLAWIEQHWVLRIGEPFQPGGETAWAAPARNKADEDLVLKVAWKHAEATHEADGLREWDGDGAVRLHASEERGQTAFLLLERCVPGTSLATKPEAEQDTVIAALLERLWKEPPAQHRIRSLHAMCEDWADEYEQKASDGRSILDPGIAREGVKLFRSLPTSADRNVLLCTDLHAANVLAAQREPWLVIDPKPHVGDRTYDPLQHILNCEQRLHSEPHALVRRLADMMDLDRERLALWLFARCVLESADWPGLASVARLLAPS